MPKRTERKVVSIYLEPQDAALVRQLLPPDRTVSKLGESLFRQWLASQTQQRAS